MLSVEVEQRQEPQVEEAIRSFLAKFEGSIGRRALAYDIQRRGIERGVCASCRIFEGDPRHRRRTLR